MRIRTTPDFSSHTATGQTSIDTVRLDALSLEQLRTSFRLDEKELLTLDPLTFTAYGGHGKGAIAVDMGRPVAAYTIRTSLQGLDVQRALAAATTMQAVLAGTAQAEATLRGSGHTADAVRQSLTGTVRFAIADGVIRNFPILAAINQAAGITAGSDSDVKFQRLDGTATVGGGQAHVDSLALRAGELAIAGTGVIGFDKRIDLQLLVQLSPEKTAEIVRTVGLGNLAAPGGRLAIPVRVTGTTTAPRFGVDLGAVAKQQIPEELLKKLPAPLQQGLEQLLPGKP
jgi:AsmA protein